MRYFCVLLLIMLSSHLYSQSSGWVDSIGFKQQRLKLGEIKQIVYSVTGDTIYSVSKERTSGLDSLWRLHSWDAKSGVLLDSFSVQSKEVKKVHYLSISQDVKTFTIVYNDTADNYHSRIYTIKGKQISYDLPFTIPISPSYNAAVLSKVTANYDSINGRLWLFLSVMNYYYNGIQIKNLLTGVGVRYSLHSSIHLTDTISTSSCVNATNTFLEELYSYVEHSYYNEILKTESKTIEEVSSYLIEGTSLYKYPLSRSADFQRIKLTTNGKDYLCCFDGTFYHFSTKPYLKLNTLFTPKWILGIEEISQNNTALLFTGSDVYLYHILGQQLIDSLHLPYKVVVLNGTSNGTIVYGSNDGYMRLMNFQNVNNSIKNDFKVLKNITYIDSNVTFVPIEKESHQRYIWNFGDGTVDTNRIAIHHYTTSGLYNITLILIDTNGKLDTIQKTKYVKIIPPLVPRFSASPRTGTVPLTVNFKDESTGEILRRKWDFGDGTTETNSNPSHIYYKESYKNVTLTIADTLLEKSITFNAYIYCDTIKLNLFTFFSKTIDQTKNVHDLTGRFVSNDNRYNCGFLTGKGNLYVSLSSCKLDIQPSSTQTYYTLNSKQSIFNFYDNRESASSLVYAIGIDNCSGGDYYKPRKIIGLNNDGVVATLMVRVLDGTSYLPSRITKDGKDIRIKEYFSHDFDGCFLPSGTDTYIFRQPTFTSLQFYMQDSVLMHKDSLIGDVMRPMPIRDSSALVVFVNPFIGSGDTTKWLLGKEYSTDGTVIFERKVEKKRLFRLTDIIDAGYGEYIICGYVTEKDTAGNSIAKGYVAKVGAGNTIVWEYVSQVWKSFVKFQKLSYGHYMVRGLPYDGFAHGFLAFKTNGTILSDNRVQGVSRDFYIRDIIINTFGTNLWLIGEESVPNEGYRAAIYTCDNPVKDITSDIVDNPKHNSVDNVIMQLTPNPVSNKFTLTYQSTQVQRTTITFFNSIGEQVYSREVVSCAGINTEDFTTQSFLPAVYYVCLINGQQNSIKPFVVVP
ncbi:MAG: PKD domain-containing protein [Bacteriodetes bacterium]|nr:PKD domain-containing protein [Bacteroidota bacterium]